MVGLIIFPIVGLWICVCVALTHLMLRKIKFHKWSWVFSLLIFTSLLVLPVIDEIIGGFQFRALCAKNAELRLGVKSPAGRTTRFSAKPAEELVGGTLVPIFHSHIQYRDIMTDELVAEYHSYVAEGGILVRSTKILPHNHPLTIEPAFCHGERGVSLPVELKFKVLN